jgi:hypothetical protein
MPRPDEIDVLISNDPGLNSDSIGTADRQQRADRQRPSRQAGTESLFARSPRAERTSEKLCMSTHSHGWYIAAPFLVGIVLIGVGLAAAYIMQAVSHPRDIEEERGLAGLLLIATFVSFLLAFISLAIGLYTLVVHFTA